MSSRSANVSERPQYATFGVWFESVAQLLEHRPFKALVLGSSPSALTIKSIIYKQIAGAGKPLVAGRSAPRQQPDPSLEPRVLVVVPARGPTLLARPRAPAKA